MTKMGSVSFPRIRIGIGAGRYIYLPVLTTTQRNALSASAGYFIYNSTTGQLETYDGAGWVALGQADLTTHEAAADPHTGYVLNAELTTHEADTSTHGVSQIDGVTERNAAIATHAANVNAHIQSIAQLLTKDHDLLTGLTDDDHTQYLLANGTRELSDNLSVASGKTIDGLDISAHNTDVGAAHGRLIVRKAVDEVVNNSDVLQSDDELGWTGMAGKEYLVIAAIKAISASATPDIKFAWTLPSGATGLHMCLASTSAGTYNVTYGLFNNTLVSDLGVNSRIIILILFCQMATTTGDCILQWAQNNKTVEDTKVEAKSAMVIHTVKTA